MFDIDRPGSVFADVSPPPDVAAAPAEPRRVPLERVEAQLCELAGHLAAAKLSYAKVRALTRIATPATEAGLAELAGPMTAN
jgi:hypothetical protein